MQSALPARTLLGRYAEPPHYTDCFTATVSGRVSLERWVRAFYTTPLFRCERLILAAFRLGSTDAELDAMLRDRARRFAAWTVEDRRDDELLMCDVNGRTRSWFRVRESGECTTRVWFGSAVLASGDALPASYRLLLPAHRFYSRRLLGAAARRLERSTV